MRNRASMHFLHDTVRDAVGPLYLAIADAICRAIDRRELRPGEQLPPQRQLAASLTVDLTTITRAYDEIRRRGRLEARVGRGSFVRDSGEARVLAETAAPPFDAGLPLLLDMNMNLPPLPPQPELRALLQQGFADLLSMDPRSLMTYRTGAGSVRDRAAAAAWLAPLFGTVDPDRIVVCAGAQVALTALLTTLTRPGDTVLTEPLTYPGLRALAAQLGLHLAAVPTDGNGLLPDALDRACRSLRPKAIYCVPTMHNPTAITMPPERRQELARIALRHRVPLLEDDAYGLLPEQPLAALSALVPGAGFTIATLSKCLAPGLRTAFVVAPGRTEAGRLVEAIRATSLTPSPLLVSLVTHWIETGTAAALRDSIRREAAARQAIARQELAGATMAAHPEGLHVWLTLPPPWSRGDFAAHARQRGLALVGAEHFAVAEPVPHAVRICLGVAERRAALQAALQALAETLRLNAPTHLAAIV